MDFLRNWIPYKLNYDSDVWNVEWLDLNKHLIKEPFFDETINACRFKMLNRSRYNSSSTLEFLTERASSMDSLEPTAFIFHVSRCGSTLLSQLLGTDDYNIVIAEAPIIDEVLMAASLDNRLSENQIEEWFKAVLKMLGQKRTGNEKHFFIKLDSWHIHHYEQLRKWFPNTPFYFLSRAPHAVINSHIKKRGIHSIPGMVSAKLLKVELNEFHHQNFNFYTSEVLKHYYQALLEIAKEEYPLNSFFDYSWGIDIVAINFFKAVGLGNRNDALMLGRLNFHSKYPDQVFAEEKSSIKADAYPEATEVYQDLLAFISIKINPTD
ncbi:hypothetical protein [Pedobacter nototheniae]|uniref:hypothetical protein n=1 Tax=Pedobacter nototheniae TaxID=2488994 RepID=UPI00104085CD|nr:hypothetical protein [Pedobacter nototheniae]